MPLFYYEKKVIKRKAGRPKAIIDWDSILSYNKRIVDDEMFIALVEEQDPMRFNNELEYQNELLNYIHDICFKLELPDIKEIYKNYDFSSYGRRAKFDILIQHKDDTITIIECKYSKDVSPGERLINQVKGMGQLILYGEMFKLNKGVSARLYLSDEKPEELTLMLLRKQNIGFISIKNNRILTFNPYGKQED